MKLQVEIYKIIEFYSFDQHSPTSYLSKPDSNSQKQYTTTTTNERTEYSTRDEKESDYGYSSSTRFRPIDQDISGAGAIRVQNIPNGAVGRPVQFESMQIILLFILPQFYLISVFAGENKLYFMYDWFLNFSRWIACWLREFGNSSKRRPCYIIGTCIGLSTFHCQFYTA